MTPHGADIFTFKPVYGNHKIRYECKCYLESSIILLVALLRAVFTFPTKKCEAGLGKLLDRWRAVFLAVCSFLGGVSYGTGVYGHH
jgi:hypothetical protein